MTKNKLKETRTSPHKQSKWETFKNFVGIATLFVFGLIVLIGLIYLFITLIENPIFSLAVICLTVFLIIIWRKK